VDITLAKHAASILMVKVTRWYVVRLYKHAVRKVSTQVHAMERERIYSPVQVRNGEQEM